MYRKLLSLIAGQDLSLEPGTSVLLRKQYLFEISFGPQHPAAHGV